MQQDCCWVVTIAGVGTLQGANPGNLVGIAHEAVEALSGGGHYTLVAANVRRLRELRRLTLSELSSSLGEVGHRILPSGLSKIEQGDRGVDVDDLVAMALALGVHPNALLFPSSATDAEAHLSANVSAPSWAAWQWAHGQNPLPACLRRREHRSVPVPRFLRHDLAQHLGGRGLDDLVFTAPRGAVLRVQNFRRRHFNRAATGIGVAGLVPHELRHTAASRPIAAGATLALDRYWHLFGDELDAVADRLDEAARAPRVPRTCPSQLLQNTERRACH